MARAGLRSFDRQLAAIVTGAIAMIRIISATLLLLSLFGQVLAADGPRRIGAADLRRISDAQYEAYLLGARMKGHAFPPDQVANGYQRSYEELKLRLIDRGYEIIGSKAAH
jgi:hypothetical protein